MKEETKFVNDKPSCLHLSLKNKWFEMTKAGIKTEDYREINDYWASRFLRDKESKLTIEQIVRYILNHKYYGYEEVQSIFKYHYFFLKDFNHNKMTLGYPKSTNTERILKFEHKGIEIRTGKPEWGAEVDKLYFVIKHGERIL